MARCVEVVFGESGGPEVLLPTVADLGGTIRPDPHVDARLGGGSGCDLFAVLSGDSAESYRAAWADADLYEFENGGVTFLFDMFDGGSRGARTVAAWGLSRKPPAARDATRQRGFPFDPDLLAAGYERGHLIAHASGGPQDANLFPQARHVNRGWSPEGKAYRALERRAAAHPGAMVFSRVIYADAGLVPTAVDLVVNADGVAEMGRFANDPTSWQQTPHTSIPGGARWPRTGVPGEVTMV